MISDVKVQALIEQEFRVFMKQCFPDVSLDSTQFAESRKVFLAGIVIAATTPVEPGQLARVANEYQKQIVQIKRRN